MKFKRDVRVLSDEEVKQNLEVVFPKIKRALRTQQHEKDLNELNGIEAHAQHLRKVLQRVREFENMSGRDPMPVDFVCTKKNCTIYSFLSTSF